MPGGRLGPGGANRYGSKHQRLRAWWKPKVQTGTVNCWRCRELIAADAAWELGHKPDGSYGGPEHKAECNQRAASRLGGLSRARAKRPAMQHPGLIA
jgi:hypothetical protein